MVTANKCKTKVLLQSLSSIAAGREYPGKQERNLIYLAFYANYSQYDHTSYDLVKIIL